MGGNIRKKATVKAPGKSARKTAKKTRSVKAVTPKAFRTDAPMRPDRLTTGPRRDLKLPVTAPTDVPVVMLEWPGDPSIMSRAFDTGADDFLRKPFSPVEMVARAKRLLVKPSDRKTERGAA